MTWGLSLIRAFWAKLVAFFAVASFKRPPQNNECYILRDLPLEIILAITDDLSTLDKIILAQTCSQFRHILHSPSQIHSSTLALAPEEHSEYLFRVSRDDPDLWACDKCHTLHVFDPKDTTRTPFYIACPSRRQYLKRDLFYFHFWPQHRHVQLALKFSRQKYLNSRQQLHYSNLTRRLHGTSMISPGRPSLRGVYEVYPKIVQGRFLLKTVQYFQDTEWNSPDLFLYGCGLTKFAACTHERLHNGDIVAARHHVRRREHQYLRMRNPQAYPILPHEEIETAVEVAYMLKGRVVERSCPQCPTDFTVQIWQTRAILCTWSDLGGETPITDEIWEIYKIHAPSFRFPYWSKGVDHEPGSVKRLYESTS